LYSIKFKAMTDKLIPGHQEDAKKIVEFVGSVKPEAMTDKKQISTIPLLEILTKYAIKHAVAFSGVESNAIVEAMQEYAEAWHSAKMQEVMDEKLSAADEKWIIEIIEKTNAFAKQLIKDHFNRHKVYSRPECPFQYCDNPEDCKKQNKCHYSDGEIKHKEG